MTSAAFNERYPCNCVRTVCSAVCRLTKAILYPECILKPMLGHKNRKKLKATGQSYDHYT